MHEYDVALRISGKTLDVTEVTSTLGLKPTQIRIAGQRRSEKSVWDESMWEYRVLSSKRMPWSSLEKGLDRIVSIFRPHQKLLRQYQRRFRVQLFCGHFSSSFDGGPTFSPPLLKVLGNFGVELFLDTYFSDEPKK
jgi:hypothetical protein